MYVLEMVQEHTRMSKEGYSKKRMNLIVKVCIYLLLQRDKLYSEQKQARWLLVTSVWVYKLNYVVGPCPETKQKWKKEQSFTLKQGYSTSQLTPDLD